MAAPQDVQQWIGEAQGTGAQVCCGALVVFHGVLGLPVFAVGVVLLLVMFLVTVVAAAAAFPDEG